MENSAYYCQEKTIQSGSSFYYSFLFLPPPQRQAIQALYAFCREVDDIVDETHDKQIAAQKLGWWQKEIEALYQGHPQHPISHALKRAVVDYKLPKEYFDKIIEGMTIDLTDQEYTTIDVLLDYCYCVASAPGILAAYIFGFQDHHTLEYAKNLGIAFQLVNIIRDVGEDLKRNRIYIPTQEMKSFSVSLNDLQEKNYSPQFIDLMHYQANRAKNYYQKALDILPEQDRYAQRAGLIMASIYFTLLNEIEKENFMILDHKIKLTPIRKFWIAWKTSRKIAKQQPLAII